MSRRNLTITAALLLGPSAWLGLPTAAQAQDAPALRDQAKVVRLSAFDVNQYKDGAWFADELRGSQVFGSADELAGHVQSIIMNKDGQVERLVVEVGGALDIGDKVIAIPWDQIDMTPGKNGVVAASLQASNLEDFSLFDDLEEITTGPRSFRAAELEGDYLKLKDSKGYGYVRDLLFDKGGKLQAIIAATDIAYGANGYYPYPYLGYGFDPGLDSYTLPYTEDDIAGHEPFDYRGWRDDEV